MESTGARRSGGVTFAAFGAAIIGLWNFLSGIAAVSADDKTEELNQVLFGIDIDVWGWAWIIVGVVQVITAVLIYQRHPAGQMLGMIWATVSATLAVFVIFSAPIWALTVLLINILIINILANDEFDQA